ncbi:hypothetical protein BH11CYA1_BH11CYA1_18140 [soil metagenome]
MSDEREAFIAARKELADEWLINKSIEKDTAELKLDTYSQIQNCFLGLCLFCGLCLVNSDLYKQQALVRHSLLHSSNNIDSMAACYQNNSEFAKLVELSCSYQAESALSLGSDAQH